LYRLDAQVILPKTAVTAMHAPSPSTITNWHRRFGHVGLSAIKTLMSKNMANGIDVDPATAPTFCAGCVHGKQHREPFPTEGAGRAMQRLGLVHSDVCGPMEVPSAGGHRYFVLFIVENSWRWNDGRMKLYWQRGRVEAPFLLPKTRASSIHKTCATYNMLTCDSPFMLPFRSIAVPQLPYCELHLLPFQLSTLPLDEL
jgi:hypothetical protein